MKPNPSDFDKWSPSLSSCCAIVSSCDPPTLDVVRAIDLAFAKNFGMVFLCPLYVDDNQARRSVPCSEVLCAEYFEANRRQVSCCTVLLDKKMRSLGPFNEWAKKTLPFVKIRTCMLASERAGHDPDIVVAFRGQESESAKEVWVVSRHLESPKDMASRIRSGGDESRWFLHGLWEFLMEKGLYNNP